MAGSNEKPGKVDDLFSAGSHDWNDPLLRHLFEESAALDVYDKSWINLAAGCPGPDLLKALTPIFREATLHRMEAEDKNNHYLFQYGPTAGLWGLREALSHFLSEQYGDTVNRADLVLTCGASHGLHLAVSILLVPDALIFVEEFTYMIALSTLQTFPMHRIIKVPMTHDGVDVDKFEIMVTEAKNSSSWKCSEQKPFWAMLYTIPTFHNPTGRLLSPESCKKLAKTAQRHDLLVFCDDVYNLLHFGDGLPPARLFSYDQVQDTEYRGGNVISNGSFSKIMAPGIRVGWMEMAPRLVTKFRKCGILQSGGSLNNVMYGLMQSIIELGLAEKHLLWYKQVYKARMSALCKSLRENLPEGCKFQEPRGGYFIWIELPVDANDFLAWGKQRGAPGAVPALRFIPPDSGPRETEIATNTNAIRLSIGFHNADILEKAGKDIGDMLKMYIAK